MNKGVIDQLKDLKHKGQKEWLQMQQERWSCTHCGHPFSWYDNTCENCNEKVDGLEK